MTEGRPGGHPRPGRRLLAVLGLALWFPLGAAALAGSALHHLASAPGRRAVCRTVAREASARLAGELSIARCAALAPWHLRVEGVRLVGPGGAPVARVEALEVRPALAALLAGRLELAAVVVEAPWVSLRREGEGLALLAALAPTAPSPPQEPEEAAASPPRIALRRVAIRRGSVDDLPGDLSVRGIELDAAVALGEETVVDASRLEAEAWRASERVVRLVDTHGVLRLAPGAVSALALRVEGPDGARAALDAALDWGPSGPAAVRADARGTLTPALLVRLGQPDAAASLRAPVGVEAHVEGPLDDLRASASLETAGGGARLEARLTPASLDASVETPGLDAAAFLADVGGRVEGRVAARVPRDGGALAAEVDLTVHAARGAGLRARRVWVGGAASGALPTPTVRLDARADGVELGAVVVREAAFALRGGPPGYDATFGAGLAPRAPGGAAPRIEGALSVRVEAGGRPDGAGAAPLRADARGDLRATALWPGGLVATLRGVRVGPDAVEADRLALRGRGLHVEAGGRFAFDGAAALRAEVHGVDLAALDRALGLDLALAGRLAGRARLRGTAARPDLEAHVALAGARLGGAPLPDVALEARWSTPARRAALDLDARLPDGGGRASAHVEAALGARADPAAALRAGRVEALVRVERLDLAFVGRLPGAPPLRGTLDASVDARGTLGAPTSDGTVRLTALELPGLPALDGALAWAVAEGRATAELRLAEPSGAPLATARVSLAERLAALARGADPWSLLAEPWHAALDVPPRRLDALPASVRVAWPIEVGLVGELRGGGGAPASGALRAEARWVVGEGGAPVPGACGADVAPSARAVLALADDAATLRLTAHLGDAEVLALSTTHPAPLEAWARGGLPAGPTPLDVDLVVTSLALADVPFACARASGTLSGRARAVGLASPAPSATLALFGRDLRAAAGPPAELTVEGGADGAGATLTVRLAQGAARPLDVVVRAPLALRDEGRAIGLGDGALSAEVTLREAPLALLLAFAPNVGRPGGTVSGRATASGRDLEDLHVEGDLRLEDAALTITDPFVRLERIRGRLALERDRVIIEGLTTAERSGSLRVDGTVARDGLRPGRVDLRIGATGFVTRREGIRVATIDGDVRVQGDLRADRPHLAVELRQLDVQLPDTVEATVQPLDPHPRVIYAGEPGFDDGLDVAQALARHRGDAAPTAPRPARPLDVSVTSRVPFWVRHPSFAMQLATDLVIEGDGAATRLRGPLTVRRGFIDLFGKSFQLERGEILFTGAVPVDALLDLKATQRVSSGHVVTVHIGGYLSEPELTFSSTDPGATSDTQIIASILGVRGGSDTADAEYDTGALLAGLVAGFVGSVTRRELGQYLPVLRVESAGTAASTQIRAGFQADQVIPDAWRDVIQGVYVEGGVAGSDGDGQTDRGVRAGFLIELFLPRHLRSTATYEQPDNWSLDVTWEP